MRSNQPSYNSRIEENNQSTSLSRRSALKGLAGAGLLGLVGIPAMTGSAAASHSGSTVYVDASNTSGTEDGSQVNPFNTIQEGVNHANSGDTVLVAAGTYSGYVTITKALILEADGQVVQQGLPNNPADGFLIQSSDVTIRGFHFQGTYFGIHTGWYPGSNIVVEDNSMSDATRGFSFSGADATTVQNNSFTDCGEGVHFNSVTNSTINDNVFIGNTYDSIHLRYTKDVVVTRNTIENDNVGFSIYQYAEGQIYDNHVATAEHIKVIAPHPGLINHAPSLNVTPTAGPNIASGPQIGGNYWSNPGGTGFSDTTTDTNGDGFSDAPYEVEVPVGNDVVTLVDNYPLVQPPSHIELSIDVKPGNGDETDPINPNGKGNIPVAVYSSDDFDATTLDVSTLRFGSTAVVDADGGASAAHGGHHEDVDGDGLMDLMLHFPSQDAGFADGDTEAKLVGQTTDTGTDAVGTDEIRIVGGKGKGNGRGR